MNSHIVDWEQILNNYFYVKNLYIKCEEIDRELLTNLQPLNEFRAALDHIMRILAKDKNIELLKGYECDVSVESKNVLGHLKRAFYDIADLLSIHIRNFISDTLEIYDTETIREVIPNYYSKMRRRVMEINYKIAELRSEKGIDTRNEAANFDSYTTIIEELLSYHLEIGQSLPLLEEIHKKGRGKKILTWAPTVVGIASLIASILIKIL